MIEKRAIVFIALVVVASGCASTTTPENSSTADSVSVMNFTAYPSSPYSGEQVRLRLTLKNTGDATAEDVTAQLFNVPFSGSGNVWDYVGDQSADKSFGTLEPRDDENNLPARPSTKVWNIKAPTLENGVTIPYNFKSRIYYKYSTQGTSRITLMSRERFQNERTRSRPTLDTTSGPIQMSIRTKSPITYTGDSPTNSQMCIQVKNEGSGTPFVSDDYDVSDSEENTVEITVPDQGSIDFSANQGDGNSAELDLVGGRGFSCFTIEATGGIGPQQEIPVIVEADYGYLKEDTQTVRVRGSRLSN
ncbi:MAG: hypothetical protein H8Z69_02890 [Nanohaloarchaea archaeon]|nr:hypothetical protein [Candidatus Nanohaloarchaea archaeon]